MGNAIGDSAPKILVIDDNPAVLETISGLLDHHALPHATTRSPAEGLNLVQDGGFDLVIADMRMPEMTGLELLQLVKLHRPETEMILITGFGSIDSAVRAMSLGAYHYLTKPFNHEELVLIIRRALAEKQLTREYEHLRKQVEERASFANMVGNTPAMQQVFAMVRKVAPTMAPVLIMGESGTGKELIARAIHQHSKRRAKTFLPINTTSLPETLLESELFGYRRGAFTGADRDKTGLLEEARGGTLFLDEIGSMSASFQGKLLRAVQESEVLPLGSNTPVPIDVRFISASNRNVKTLVDADVFREDLYYRLNVIEITLPPLRERVDDIVPLANHFLARACIEHGVGPKRLNAEAIKLLLAHGWPGNARELENAIRRAVIVSNSAVIGVGDILLGEPGLPRFHSEGVLALQYEEAKGRVQDEFQRAYLTRLFKQSRGNISRAARTSGLTRQALYKMMKRLDLEPDTLTHD
ncbi:MAG: sigma-54-dependent Fis family transcriptional regulator [Verrucomicrobia bacterium]|nr:sigma-54-dependent Fis family transcriptional regulator [Verrucomicrobiota bacterium]